MKADGTLAALRDTLLPKLLSGGIRFKIDKPTGKGDHLWISS